MRLRPSLFFVAIAALALSAAAPQAQAQAQAQALAPASPACTAATCTLQDFEAVRDTTETLYGDVLLVLSAHERPALRGNQNEWRRTARQHCQQAAPAGPDLHAPAASAHHACMIEQHALRRQALRHWLMHGYSVE
ncbi:lysozyme inhibitor LprI family protein [Vandammella animalimorsus]|uniref:lysozyme inhibitor LprI family protein n=1 Tax=Vandammella animalimorsus TaxID=2029117 RepID=UPI0031BBA9A8